MPKIRALRSPRKGIICFKSYLSNHKQYCKGVESELMDISIAVTRGSCLGPLLFFLYIIVLPQAVKNSTVAMYADDTSISYRSDDIVS